MQNSKLPSGTTNISTALHKLQNSISIGKQKLTCEQLGKRSGTKKLED